MKMVERHEKRTVQNRKCLEAKKEEASVSFPIKCTFLFHGELNFAGIFLDREGHRYGLGDHSMNSGIAPA